MKEGNINLELLINRLMENINDIFSTFGQIIR